MVEDGLKTVDGEMSLEEASRLPENNKALEYAGGMTGYRTVGKRKAKLLHKMYKEFDAIAKKGINADYVSKFLFGKKRLSVLSLKTKNIPGMISELKQFRLSN
jgi:hypothetical protein